MVNDRKFQVRGFKKPLTDIRGDRTQAFRRTLREQEESIRQITQTGTNYILNELFGLSNKSRNEYADEYGSKTLKHGSRMAAQHFYQTGELTDLRFFFEAYRQLGSSGAIDLLRSRRDIGKLLTEYDVNTINGMRVLTPHVSGASLESKATVNEATRILKDKGLAPVYKGRTLMIFDYK